MQVSLYLNNHIPWQNTINTALSYLPLAVIRSHHVELESSKTAANSSANSECKVHNYYKSVILEAAAFFTVSRPGFEGPIPSVSQHDGGISGTRQKERIQKDDYLHLLSLGKHFRF